MTTIPPPPNVPSPSVISTLTTTTSAGHSNLTTIPPPPNVLSPGAVSTSSTTTPAGHSNLGTMFPPPNAPSPGGVSTSTSTTTAGHSNHATIPPPVLSPSAVSTSTMTTAGHANHTTIPPPPNIPSPSAVSTSTTTTPATMIEGLSNLAQGAVEGHPNSSRETILGAQVLLQNSAKNHERKTKAKTKKLVTELRTGSQKRKQPEPDLKKPAEPLTKKKKKMKGSWFWHNPVTDSYFDQDNNLVDKNGNPLDDI